MIPYMLLTDVLFNVPRRGENIKEAVEYHPVKGRVRMGILEKDKYLIGDVSKICNIPKKTLRYYDTIDVIKPEKISEYNSYRYYSLDNMHDIIILKYFKQMGYSLNEIRNNFSSHNYNFIMESLSDKVVELNEEKRRLENRIMAATDWKLLIEEAGRVIKEGDRSVRVKELEEAVYPCMEQDFRYNYKESIINILWVKTLEINDEEITGPVILKFDSHAERVAGKEETVTILQKGLNNTNKGINKTVFGGKFLATYHAGSIGSIGCAYERMGNYAKERGIRLSESSYERYVVDYWTTSDESLFVTEILIKIEE